MERWHTKEDVMKDLALANGLGVNFEDDSFIISGTRPPPPPRHLKDEDEELEIRYGRFAGDYHENLKPDLQGISKMLALVNEPQKTNKHEKKPEETRIVISKLNPQVPPFVPNQAMNLTNKSHSSFNGVIINNNNVILESNSEPRNSCEKKESSIKKVSENDKEVNHEHYLGAKENGEHTNGKSCDQNDDDKLQEKSKLEAILKEKIIESAKAKTIKEKSARNVAIAALLKLKSGPPQSPVTTTSSESKISRSDSPASSNTSNDSPKKTLILHPPNFYEAKITDAQEDNVTSLPQSAELDNSNSKENVQKESEKGTVLNREPAEVAKSMVNPEEQESIQKVMNWLNQPEKPKPLEPPHIEPFNFKKRDAAPITGPIVYRKKEKKESPKSPASEAGTASETGTSSEAGSKKPTHSLPGAFVPSQYASDLAKQYAERAKANEERQLDMWSKLERDLKARDEIVKERMKAQSETSPTDSRGSSRCSSRRQNNQ